MSEQQLEYEEVEIGCEGFTARTLCKGALVEVRRLGWRISFPIANLQPRYAEAHRNAQRENLGANEQKRQAQIASVLGHLIIEIDHQKHVRRERADASRRRTR